MKTRSGKDIYGDNYVTSTETFKIGETLWEFDLTTKKRGKNLVTSATASRINGMSKIHRLFSDYSERVAVNPGRATVKALEAQQASVDFGKLMQDAIAHTEKLEKTDCAH